MIFIFGTGLATVEVSQPLVAKRAETSRETGKLEMLRKMHAHDPVTPVGHDGAPRVDILSTTISVTPAKTAFLCTRCLDYA